jgi:hypothetical protein
VTKAKISEYDASAGNNTDVNNVNIAEGCAPSGINNAIREVMAALKRFETGADGDSVTVGGSLVVSGTATLSTTTTGPINGTTIPSSKTLLVSTDIGVTVQGYDADTVKYDDVNPSFTDTGALKLPVGTEAQRPGTPATGQLRFNDDSDEFEGYNGTAWGGIGGGASAGGAIYVNNTTADTSYTIEAGSNGFSVGPITVDTGVTITVSSGQRWLVL